MPLINIHYENSSIANLKNELHDLKVFVAKQLTCNDIILKPEEVSIRLINSGELKIAPIEIDIFAHSFKDRVDKQDKICLNVRKFIMTKFPEFEDVRVWLILSELGHSW